MLWQPLFKVDLKLIQKLKVNQQIPDFLCLLKCLQCPIKDGKITRTAKEFLQLELLTFQNMKKHHLKSFTFLWFSNFDVCQKNPDLILLKFFLDFLSNSSQFLVKSRTKFITWKGDCHDFWNFLVSKWRDNPPESKMRINSQLHNGNGKDRG